MRVVPLILLLAAACSKKAEVAPVAPAAQPNAVEKYVGGLQNDVKATQGVKEKADEANKKAEEAAKIQE